MKNSNATTVKSVAVDTVKIIVYPAHLVCQTTADLLNIGQAKAINLIDGTPVLESMREQSEWTQNIQAKVVGKGMEIRERMLKQRLFNKEQDIAKLEKLTADKKAKLAAEPVAVPAPPVEETFIPINQRKKIIQNTEVPLMSPNAVFAQ